MKTVFVSSTFKDMHFERDAIQDITLPKLNSEASKYSQRVSFCDLRWGVNTTDLDSDEGSKKVLEVCLDEIDRCKPPMVVILGDRYGWIPDEKLITTAAERKSIKLEDYQTSVTALEIEYGALSDEEKRNRTLFYFREIENEAPAQYGAEDEQHKAKLDALKSKIVKLTGGRIKTYKVKWNGSGFEGMDSFANMLADDLAQMLKPQWEEYAQLTPFEREIHTHKTFIAEKSAMFRARKSLADEILTNIKNNSLTVIKGASGSGKSTLLSFVARELADNGENILPFICGLTSQTNDAMDILKNIIFYFEEKLGYEHFDDETDPATGEKKKHSTEEWRTKLDELCGAYSYGGNKVIIVVDAVDQLLANELRDQLVFIPHNLDENVKFVFSCLADFKTTGMEYIEIKPLDATDKREVIAGTLSSTGRQLADAVIDEMVKMSSSDNALFLSLLIQRLTMMNRFDFDIINSGDKNDQMSEISKRQIEIIRTCPEDLNKMCVALLDEAGKRINPELVRKAAIYISVSRHGLRPEDLEKLIGENWDTVDFAHFAAYMSDSFMLRNDGRYDFTHKSIRAGFREICENEHQIHRDILEHFKSLPEEDSVRITEIIYHCIKADDKQYFAAYVKKYEYADDETYISKAVKDTYNCCMEDNGDWILNLIETFICAGLYDQTAHFINEHFYDMITNNRTGLIIFKKIYFKNLLFLKTIKNKNNEIKTELAKSCTNLGSIDLEIGREDDNKEAMSCFTESAKIREELYKDQKSVDNQINLINAYSDLGDLFHILSNLNNSEMADEFIVIGIDKEKHKTADQYYKKALELSEQLFLDYQTDENLKILLLNYLKLAILYNDYSSNDSKNLARKYFKKALDLANQISNTKQTEYDIINLSSIYIGLGDTYFSERNVIDNIKAIEFYQKAAEIAETAKKNSSKYIYYRIAYSLSEAYEKLGNAYKSIGDIYNYEQLCEDTHENIEQLYKRFGGEQNRSKAFEYYNKCMKIREQLVSETKTSFFYYNLAQIYQNIGMFLSDKNVATEYLYKSLDIYKILYKRDGHEGYKQLILLNEIEIKLKEGSLYLFN